MFHMFRLACGHRRDQSQVGYSGSFYNVISTKITTSFSTAHQMNMAIAVGTNKTITTSIPRLEIPYVLFEVYGTYLSTADQENMTIVATIGDSKESRPVQSSRRGCSQVSGSHISAAGASMKLGRPSCHTEKSRESRGLHRSCWFGHET